MLNARAVRAGYGPREVLHGVDLDARGGEVLALVGPNGSGKSTLLRVLAGLVTPSSGSVTLDGIDIATLDRRAIARGIAVVPQVFDTLFPFSVREVVGLGRTARLGWLGKLAQRDVVAVERALGELELRELHDRRIDRLSGGERQRAVLGMALAQETGVLLLDEPTAHLDPAHQRATLDRLATLARARGIAVVAVLHDLNLASALASRVMVLSAGRIVRDGDARDVITPDIVREIFGAGLRVICDHGRPYVLPE